MLILMLDDDFNMEQEAATLSFQFVFTLLLTELKADSDGVKNGTAIVVGF